MPRRHESPRTVRIVGALLAMLWLCAGAAALIAGAAAHQWIRSLAGLFAIWYGVIWAFVALQGRRFTAREALTPWRLFQ
jgi:hypothetical protein